MTRMELEYNQAKSIQKNQDNRSDEYGDENDVSPIRMTPLLLSNQQLRALTDQESSNSDPGFANKVKQLVDNYYLPKPGSQPEDQHVQQSTEADGSHTEQGADQTVTKPIQVTLEKKLENVTNKRVREDEANVSLFDESPESEEKNHDELKDDPLRTADLTKMINKIASELVPAEDSDSDVENEERPEIPIIPVMMSTEAESQAESESSDNDLPMPEQPEEVLCQSSPYKPWKSKTAVIQAKTFDAWVEAIQNYPNGVDKIKLQAQLAEYNKSLSLHTKNTKARSDKIKGTILKANNSIYDLFTVLSLH